MSQVVGMEQTTGKGVIIVGPGKHFGAELVGRFVAAGYAVGVVARCPEGTEEIWQSRGGRVLTAAADVADSDEFGAALRTLAARLGEVRGLIYNPKASFRASALALEASDLEQSLTVNVTGAMVAIKTLLPWLEAQGGSVILTGGGYKDEPDLDKFALSVGKAGLHALYRSLNQPLQRRGITMKTVVIDGFVRRSGQGSVSSGSLADFYYSIFTGGSNRVHRFPKDAIVTNQLNLF